MKIVAPRLSTGHLRLLQLALLVHNIQHLVVIVETNTLNGSCQFVLKSQQLCKLDKYLGFHRKEIDSMVNRAESALICNHPLDIFRFKEQA